MRLIFLNIDRATQLVSYQQIKIPQRAYFLCGIFTLTANTDLYHITLSSYVFAMVEMAVIETASENRSV